MLDCDCFRVEAKDVANDLRFVTVTAPDAVPALEDQVVYKLISAKGGLNSIGRRMAEIIAEEEVVITAAFAVVHGRLPSPQEETIPSVSH